MELDDVLESNGFQIIPAWMDKAIQSKAKNMTVGLANSKEYKLNELDAILGTAPLMQRINTEVN